MWPRTLKNRDAHRAAWVIYKGPIPNNVFVLHKCDVAPCVNPDHLYLGNHRQNMRDQVERGRSPKGEKNPAAKLSDVQVQEIRDRRKNGEHAASIMNAFRISQAHFYRIINHERR